VQHTRFPSGSLPATVEICGVHDDCRMKRSGPRSYRSYSRDAAKCGEKREVEPAKARKTEVSHTTGSATDRHILMAHVLQLARGGSEQGSRDSFRRLESRTLSSRSPPARTPSWDPPTGSARIIDSVGNEEKAL